MKTKPKLIIIGAGLSGLYCAYLLQNDYEVTILEARSRMGGRVLGVGEHDLGPSWIWSHQKNILQLVDELGLELFTQHTEGMALYDTPAGIQEFTPPPQAPSARITGGIIRLVEALYLKLDKHVLHFNEVVTAISSSDDKLNVTTQTGSYTADKVISTLPPRLALQNIKYSPDLDSKTKLTMQNIPTWMGHASKCVIEYKNAFWQSQGRSGFAFSPLGPLSEIHDACTQNHAALFGFALKGGDEKTIKQDIISQLVRIFGEDAEDFSDFHLIDWKKEPFSSTADDALGLTAHPNYGLSITHFNHQLFFSGTETALDEGGYLEGALISADQTAKELLNTSKK